MFSLPLYLLASSADNLSKQFGHGSGPTCPNLFGTLRIFLYIYKRIFGKIWFEFEWNQQTTKEHEKLPIGKELRNRNSGYWYSGLRIVNLFLKFGEYFFSLSDRFFAKPAYRQNSSKTSVITPSTFMSFYMNETVWGATKKIQIYDLKLHVWWVAFVPVLRIVTDVYTSVE